MSIKVRKKAFIQPRFVGDRFREHTLPVTAARDLAAYEDLVVELAKHLYRQRHPERERVPKGYTDGFNLHLERIDGGSAQPLLSVVVATALLDSIPSEIEEAKDLINRVIDVEEDKPLPPEFPKELYSYFNRIGRSLEPGESIEWDPLSAGNRSVLTQTKRKRLALAHRETYEAEVDVVGLVNKIDTDNKTGTLKTEEGAVVFVYSEPFFSDIKSALGVHYVFAHIEGVGIFDVNDRLVSIKEIEKLECVPHYHLVSEIDSLSSLEDGWLEGSGLAPTNKNLSWLAEELSMMFPEGLKYPAVVPTEDGNAVLEWMLPKARIELEINFTNRSLELYATDIDRGHFEEHEFKDTDWLSAFRKVKELVL